MTSTAWQPHPESPTAWAVFDDWGTCIAAVAPQPDADGYWQGVIRPRPDQGYEGVRIDHCPSKEQAMGVVARELQIHWPEVVRA
jgi:hypothetical protein